MNVGSGLIGRELYETYGDVNYAAGVSNSSCVDAGAFRRDSERLAAQLKQPGRIVYISTASQALSPYVAHKRALEDMVRARGNYIICRLPIVAGRSGNSHTLLNSLWTRIKNGDQIELLEGARRNVIDVKDAALLVRYLSRQPLRDRTVDVGAPFDYSVREIAEEMAGLCGQTLNAKPVKTLPSTTPDYPMELDWVKHSGVVFMPNYLPRTIQRYYT